MKLAHSVRKKHPRDVLPAEIGEIVGNCLETRPEQTAPGNKNGRTHVFVVISSDAAGKRRALLRGGHHGTLEPGGAVAPVAKNGVGRPARRRRRARFQQHAHHHPGTFQLAARAAGAGGRNRRSRPGHLFRRRTRRRPHAPTAHVQPQKRDAAPAARPARDRRQHEQNARTAHRRKHHAGISSARHNCRSSSATAA